MAEFKFVPGSPGPKRGRPVRQPIEGQQSLGVEATRVQTQGKLNGSAFEQAFKNIDDVLWKEAGCSNELDYVEQTSWLLFLKYLDGLEQDRATEAALQGKPYAFILDASYRWETWAAE